MTDRAEWLEWRRGGITATDAAKCAGLSPYGSPWSVWANKVGLVPDEEADNPLMANGRRMEAVLLQWFHEDTGLYVVGEGGWVEHPDEPWMIATLDGMAAEPPHGELETAIGVIECKVTGDSEQAWREQVPVHYQAQCQWQMLVTGTSVAYMPTFHRMSGVFAIHEVPRDEADIAHLVRAARSLWFDHVLTGIAPETDGSDATTAALNAAWEPDPEFTLHAGEHLASLVSRLRDAKEDARAANERVTELENAIKAEMGEATTLLDGIGPDVLATWKPQTRQSYTVPESTSRVFRLKSPKKER